MKKTLKDIEVSGKKVLMRVDFNVPLDKETGEITDETRIQKAIPSLRYIINNGGSVILMSHLGRPKGKVDVKVRLGKVGDRLSELIEMPVTVLDDCIGSQVSEAVDRMEMVDIILLENVRFHKGEESKDENEKREFANRLFSVGDVYIN